MKSANPLPFRVLRCRVHAHIGKLRYRITLPGQKRPTFVWQDAVAQGTELAARGLFCPSTGTVDGHRGMLVGIPTGQGKAPAIYLLQGKAAAEFNPHMEDPGTADSTLPVHLIPAYLRAHPRACLALEEIRDGRRHALSAVGIPAYAIERWHVAKDAVGIPTSCPLSWCMADGRPAPRRAAAPPAAIVLRLAKFEVKDFEEDGYHLEPVHRYAPLTCREPDAVFAQVGEGDRASLYRVHSPEEAEGLLRDERLKEEAGKAERQKAREQAARVSQAAALLCELTQLKPSQIDPTLQGKRLARFVADLRQLQHDLAHDVAERNVYWYYRHPVLGAIYDTAFPF